MSIKVHELTPPFYSQTIEVIQKAIRISQGKIYSSNLIEKLCHKYDLERFKEKAKEIEYFIAQDDQIKKVLGVIGLKNGELRTFFVDPDYQGKGIGRLLYDHLENVARTRGFQKLFLYGGSLGEPAYLKFGFKKIKTVDKEIDGIHFEDTYMEKELV